MAELMSIVPKIVLCELLHSWMSLSEVGKLDSALCVHETRPAFEHMLSSGVWQSSSDSVNLFEDLPFLAWAIKYRMQLNEIHVREGLDDYSTLRADFLSTCTQRSHRVHVGAVADPKSVLIDLALSCCDLWACEIEVEADIALFPLLSRNPNLRKLSVLDLSGINVVQMLRFCRSLTKLHVEGRVDYAVFSEIVDNCPETLEVLSLPAAVTVPRRSNILERIFKRYVHLLELRMGAIDVAEVESLAKNSAPNLLLFRFKATIIENKHICHLAKSMPHLQTLIVLDSGSIYIPSCILDQSQIMLVLTQFPGLRQLVTMTAGEHLIRPHPLPALPTPPVIPASEDPHAQLEEILLIRKTTVIDFSVLLAHCPLLRNIGADWMGLQNLNACTQLSVQRLVLNYEMDCAKAVRGCRELVMLDCQHATESMLFRIAVNNPELEVLHLKQLSRQISHQCIVKFLRMCPKLHSAEFLFDERSRRGKECILNNECTALLLHCIRKLYPNIKHIKTNISSDEVNKAARRSNSREYRY